MSIEKKPTSRPASHPQEAPSSKTQDQTARTEKEPYRIRDWASI